MQLLITQIQRFSTLQILRNDKVKDFGQGVSRLGVEKALTKNGAFNMDDPPWERPTEEDGQEEVRERQAVLDSEVVIDISPELCTFLHGYLKEIINAGESVGAVAANLISVALACTNAESAAAALAAANRPGNVPA